MDNIETAIGIDLGGTAIKACLLDKNGNAQKEITVVTQTRAFEAVCDQLAELVKELKGDHTPQGICLAVPGGIREDRRTISQSPNFPGWHNVDIVTALTQRGLANIYVENDANLAALGEFGLIEKAENMLFFTLGTGVGGAVILNKRLWTGACGMAGELGHITIYPDGLQCGCGNQGCLEQYASATAVQRAGRQAHQRNLTPILSRKIQDNIDKINPELMAEAAREGDRGCISTFDKAGQTLGIAIASLVNTLNIGMIRFGGGLSKALDLMTPAMEAEVHKRTFREPAALVSIAGAKLGNRAGMVGAANYVFQLTSEGDNITPFANTRDTTKARPGNQRATAGIA